MVGLFSTKHKWQTLTDHSDGSLLSSTLDCRIETQDCEPLTITDVVITLDYTLYD